jgi:formamidopyrimidine-DNA glycosylase
MPELPEVETARRGIAPHLVGQRVARVVVRERRLRWPVPAALGRQLPGQVIRAVERRAKYLLLRTDAGTAILHLGMSGSLRVVPCATPPTRWDHVDIALANGKCLRLRDPRRFGALLWTTADPADHKLLRDLGPEPLDAGFSAEYLYQAARGRRLAARDFLLNTRVVAGIGNIYANETLFLSGIRPQRAAGRIPHARCAQLVAAIRDTLQRAIRAGGTTLRDFQNADGLPGYFQQTLNVYGRTGEPCPRCGTPIRSLKLGQRSAFYCPQCQR